ncbi:hypothetical protein AAJ76_1630004382 [Vairimorpha ceranae]|uniref:Uncharacterized protein n=1 Tax=Vairimorpha ceranae TaxID=40302 RepID=A0A0F9Z7Q2_9MICR|nr:hypothetical protein AAJ76_1630004382 [Vairimorpha ceranae]KKO73954.1 hypothetical protein AAJ76_1630004382 [Vairimorpha ceranae]
MYSFDLICVPGMIRSNLKKFSGCPFLLSSAEKKWTVLIKDKTPTSGSSSDTAYI